MPICAAVDAILSDRLSVSDAVEALLARPQKSEA
jgi:glycerol-3-phosphate dehydrogenase (NAD(P)+)